MICPCVLPLMSLSTICITPHLVCSSAQFVSSAQICTSLHAAFIPFHSHTCSLTLFSIAHSYYHSLTLSHSTHTSQVVRVKIHGRKRKAVSSLLQKPWRAEVHGNVIILLDRYNSPYTATGMPLKWSKILKRNRLQ